MDFFDIIPRFNSNHNRYSEDLKIIDFILYRFGKVNTYHVPIYILTDRVCRFDGSFYETIVRIGFSDNYEVLNFEELCYSKLEAYSQHKLIYKKLLKGFYDKEIKKIVDKGWCPIK